MLLKTHHFLLLVLCVLTTQCGTSFQIQPLIGEDPEIVQMIGASGDATDMTPTVQAIERFYRAARSRDAGKMWSMLTKETHIELNKLGRKLDSNGKALLKSAQFPVTKNGQTSVKQVNLVALFLVRRPINFSALDTPGPAAVRSAVDVSNSYGEKRRITLHRSKANWLIHQTNFSTLPKAGNKRPLLLPQDQPKKPKRTQPASKKTEPNPSATPPKKESTLDF